MLKNVKIKKIGAKVKRRNKVDEYNVYKCLFAEPIRCD